MSEQEQKTQIGNKRKRPESNGGENEVEKKQKLDNGGASKKVVMKDGYCLTSSLEEYEQWMYGGSPGTDSKFLDEEWIKKLDPNTLKFMRFPNDNGTHPFISKNLAFKEMREQTFGTAALVNYKFNGKSNIFTFQTPALYPQKLFFSKNKEGIVTKATMHISLFIGDKDDAQRVEEMTNFRRFLRALDIAVKNKLQTYVGLEGDKQWLAKDDPDLDIASIYYDAGSIVKKGKKKYKDENKESKTYGQYLRSAPSLTIKIPYRKGHIQSNFFQIAKKDEEDENCTEMINKKIALIDLPHEEAYTKPKGNKPSELFWSFKPCQLYLMIDFKTIWQSVKAELYPQLTLGEAYVKRYVKKEQVRATFQQPANNSKNDEFPDFEGPLDEE